MGDRSGRKKVASPYVVLENRPLDLWKVTELKEELKKRKLITRGLKEELVKRLDEAVRAEMDDEESNHENDYDGKNTLGVMDHTGDDNKNLEKDNKVDDLDNKNDEKTDFEIGMDMVHVDDGLQSLAEKMVVQEISVETTVMVSEESGGGSNQEPRNGEPKPESQSPKQEQADPGSSEFISGKQVDEVSNVQSDFISIDTISSNEMNELKDNVIADDVKLEINNKPEMVQPSTTNNVLDDSKSEAVEVAEEKDISNVESTVFFNEKDNVIANDVNLGPDAKFLDESLPEKVTAEEKCVNDAENIDISKKNDSGDVGSSEKLNLDRSSGDYSIEEDALESKQVDSKFSADEVGNKREKVEVKDDDAIHVVVEDATVDKNFVAFEDKTAPSVTSTKRKPHDQEKAAENNEKLKRQRWWNSENLEVPKQQSTNGSTSTTPKDAFQTHAKHAFSRSESTNSQDLPKERIVPPSSKTPTTSLRIDNFLRPFTLKAVQEFLGKTGTVVNFWMDQIKTHCYITYASVEEAIETRNAVYNLQWPVNGGRLLMADFVDPQEVKNRVDQPPPSPTILATTMPSATMQPPPPEKNDPPIVTLDDLFRKTRATPRIYYLPLSDEQVAVKLNAREKPGN
ncbi:hypothetical protein SSX86_007964 [Deinandra increscens subsp. villosa]|uniref:SAP domain-containing protein n=1 Tax=Deinandra increscens subsp. villosa TaxID=3103831 RepID=A0AAP0H429_9ASTR